MQANSDLDRKAIAFTESLMAELRKVEDTWPRGNGDAHALRTAVLGFLAHAIELSREYLFCREQAIAGPLLLRILWHNAGCLAWLLHGPNTLKDRLVVCADDQSIRNFEVLVGRSESVFAGVPDVQGWLRHLNEQAAALRQEADDARSRQERPEAKRTDWARLTPSELSDAMQNASRVDDADMAKGLADCVRYVEIAKLTGDDMAHPNPFVMLQVLELLDPETGRIRHTGVSNRLLNPSCQLMLLVQLLVLHAAAIFKHEPKFIPLRTILERFDQIPPSS